MPIDKSSPALIGGVVLLALGGGCGGKSTRYVDDDTSAGGPGDVRDERLLPLEVGRRWSFQATALDPSLPIEHCSRAFEATVPGTVARDELVGWEYRPACGPLFHMFLHGDEIRGYENGTSGEPYLYAMPPVEEGASWDSGSGLGLTWRDEGTVSVRAGTFDRCWRRVWLGNEESYIVLCRGVGMVSSHAPGDNYFLELDSKNF